MVAGLYMNLRISKNTKEVIIVQTFLVAKK